jgi:hypothetical protein
MPQPSIPKSPLPNSSTIPFLTRSDISNNAQNPSPFANDSKPPTTGSGSFGGGFGTLREGGLFGSGSSHRNSQRSPSPFGSFQNGASQFLTSVPLEYLSPHTEPKPHCDREFPGAIGMCSYQSITALPTLTHVSLEVSICNPFCNHT